MPLVATIGSRPSTVNRSVPDCTIHHSRVSPFIRRGVFLPGPIEIHLAFRLSSSTTVCAQSDWLLCAASTSASFVCGLCTPVHPGEVAFGDKPCFLLTDHIPMPKKTFGSLERLGAKKVTLGATMLFASQCIVLIHHALDEG